MSTVRPWYDLTAIFRSLALRPRFYGGALAGIATLLLAPHAWPNTVRVSLAWDVGGAVYLLFAFRLIMRCDAQHIKAIAARRDDSRAVILTVILLAIAASFVSIGQLISHAKAPNIEAGEKVLLAALAGTTIVISWAVTQIAFALHYAHAFYRPDEKSSDALGGLSFANTDAPDYRDFVYFSFTIGATSQTSDVVIASRHLRRLATLHGVIAFFFNTAVLALTINIASSLV